MINRNQYQKVNDRKVLHKVKKNWVVVSLAFLSMLGVAGFGSSLAHAQATTKPSNPEPATTTKAPQANNIKGSVKNTQPTANGRSTEAEPLSSSSNSAEASSSIRATSASHASPVSQQADSADNKVVSSASYGNAKPITASDLASQPNGKQAVGNANTNLAQEAQRSITYNFKNEATNQTVASTTITGNEGDSIYKGLNTYLTPLYGYNPHFAYDSVPSDKYTLSIKGQPYTFDIRRTNYGGNGYEDPQNTLYSQGVDGNGDKVTMALTDGLGDYIYTFDNQGVLGNTNNPEDGTVGVPYDKLGHVVKAFDKYGQYPANTFGTPGNLSVDFYLKPASQQVVPKTLPQPEWMPEESYLKYTIYDQTNHQSLEQFIANGLPGSNASTIIDNFRSNHQQLVPKYYLYNGVSLNGRMLSKNKATLQYPSQKSKTDNVTIYMVTPSAQTADEQITSRQPLDDEVQFEGDYPKHVQTTFNIGGHVNHTYDFTKMGVTIPKGYQIARVYKYDPNTNPDEIGNDFGSFTDEGTSTDYRLSGDRKDTYFVFLVESGCTPQKFNGMVNFSHQNVNDLTRITDQRHQRSESASLKAIRTALSAVVAARPISESYSASSSAEDLRTPQQNADSTRASEHASQVASEKAYRNEFGPYQTRVNSDTSVANSLNTVITSLTNANGQGYAHHSLTEAISHLQTVRNQLEANQTALTSMVNQQARASLGQASKSVSQEYSSRSLLFRLATEWTDPAGWEGPSYHNAEQNGFKSLSDVYKSLHNGDNYQAKDYPSPYAGDVMPDASNEAVQLSNEAVAMATNASNQVVNLKQNYARNMNGDIANDASKSPTTEMVNYINDPTWRSENSGKYQALMNDLSTNNLETIFNNTSGNGASAYHKLTNDINSIKMPKNGLLSSVGQTLRLGNILGYPFIQSKLASEVEPGFNSLRPQYGALVAHLKALYNDHNNRVAQAGDLEGLNADVSSFVAPVIADCGSQLIKSMVTPQVLGRVKSDVQTGENNVVGNTFVDNPRVDMLPGFVVKHLLIPNGKFQRLASRRASFPRFMQALQNLPETYNKAGIDSYLNGIHDNLIPQLQRAFNSNYETPLKANDDSTAKMVANVNGPAKDVAVYLYDRNHGLISPDSQGRIRDLLNSLSDMDKHPMNYRGQSPIAASDLAAVNNDLNQLASDPVFKGLGLATISNGIRNDEQQINNNDANAFDNKNDALMKGLASLSNNPQLNSLINNVITNKIAVKNSQFNTNKTKQAVFTHLLGSLSANNIKNAVSTKGNLNTWLSGLKRDLDHFTLGHVADNLLGSLIDANRHTSERANQPDLEDVIKRTSGDAKNVGIIMSEVKNGYITPASINNTLNYIRKIQHDANSDGHSRALVTDATHFKNNVGNITNKLPGLNGANKVAQSANAIVGAVTPQQIHVTVHFSNGDNEPMHGLDHTTARATAPQGFNIKGSDVVSFDGNNGATIPMTLIPQLVTDTLNFSHGGSRQINGAPGTKKTITAPIGYHITDPSNQQLILGDSDQTISIPVTANNVHDTITFDDAKGRNVGTKTVNGQAFGTKPFTAPAGYHLKTHANSPVHFGAGNETQTVSVEPNTITNTVIFSNGTQKTVQGPAFTSRQVNLPAGYHLLGQDQSSPNAYVNNIGFGANGITARIPVAINHVTDTVDFNTGASTQVGGDAFSKQTVSAPQNFHFNNPSEADLTLGATDKTVHLDVSHNLPNAVTDAVNFTNGSSTSITGAPQSQHTVAAPVGYHLQTPTAGDITLGDSSGSVSVPVTINHVTDEVDFSNGQSANVSGNAFSHQTITAPAGTHFLHAGEANLTLGPTNAKVSRDVSMNGRNIVNGTVHFLDGGRPDGLTQNVSGHNGDKEPVVAPDGYRLVIPNQKVVIGTHGNDFTASLRHNLVKDTIDFGNGSKTSVRGDSFQTKNITAPNGYHFNQTADSHVHLGASNQTINVPVVINHVVDTVHFSNDTTGMISGNAFSKQPVSAPNGYHLTNGNESPVTLGANDGNVSIAVTRDAQPIANQINFSNGGHTTVNGYNGNQKAFSAPDGYHFSDQSYHNGPITVMGYNTGIVTIGGNNNSVVGTVPVAANEITDTVDFSNGDTKQVHGQAFGHQTVSAPQNFHYNNPSEATLNFGARGKTVHLAVTHNTPSEITNTVNFSNGSHTTVTGNADTTKPITPPAGYHFDLTKPASGSIIMASPTNASVVITGHNGTVAGSAPVAANQVTDMIDFSNNAKGSVTGPAFSQQPITAPQGFKLANADESPVTLGATNGEIGIVVVPAPEAPAKTVTDTLAFTNGDNSQVQGQPGDKKTVVAPNGYHLNNPNESPVTIGNNDSAVSVPVTINNVTDTINFTNGGGTLPVHGDAFQHYVISAPNGYHFNEPSEANVTLGAGDTSQTLAVTRNAKGAVTDEIDFNQGEDNTVLSHNVTGMPGQSISITAPDGYQLDNPADSSITLGRSDNIVPISVRPKLVIALIHFSQGSDHVISGNAFSQQNISDDVPNGYHLVNPSNATVTLGDASWHTYNIPVVANSTNQASDVTEHLTFIDNGTKGTADVTGTPSSVQSITDKVPSGYHIADPSNDSIMLGSNNGSKSIPVAINHVTDTLHFSNGEDQSISGDALSQQPVTAPNGYHLNNADESPVTLSANGGQTDEIAVAPNGASLVTDAVNFTNGGETEVTGAPQSVQTVSAPDGFHFNNPANANVHLGNSDGSVTIPVTADTITDTVDFSNGETSTVSGNAYSGVTITPPINYHFVNPEDANITLSDNDQTIHVTVAHNPADNVSDIVNFTNGSSTAVAGAPGEKKTIVPPVGYHLNNPNESPITLGSGDNMVSIPVTINHVTDTLHYSNGDTGSVSGNAFSTQSVTAPQGFHLNSGSEATVTLGANDADVNVPVTANTPNNVTETINFSNGASSSVSGTPGAQKSITAPSGYHFNNPSDANVTLGNSSGSHTVPVTINHVTDMIDFSNGATAAVSGNAFTPQTITPPEHYHFNNPANADITLGANNQTIHVNVSQNAQNDVTDNVHFSDGSSTSVSGAPGSEKSVDAPEGYHFNTPSDGTITLGNHDGDVNIPVTINNVTNTVHFTNGSSTSVSGDAFSNQEVSAPNGYHYTVDGEGTITLGANNGTNTLPVAINNVTDTVHFSNGETTTVSGNAFSKQPITPPENQHLTNDSESPITLGPNDGSVNISVTPNTPSQVTDTVNFTHGGSISVSGAPGSSQPVTAPDGYQLSNPSDSSVTLGNHDQTISVPVTPKQVSDTLNFSNGDSSTVTGDAFSTQSITPPNGYQFDSPSENTITFGADSGSVDVPVEPKQVTDTINFTNGDQSQVSGPAQSSQPVTVPNGYHLNNPSDATVTLGDNNGSKSVPVTINNVTDTIHFSNGSTATVNGNAFSQQNVTPPNGYHLNNNNDSTVTLGANNFSSNVPVTINHVTDTVHFSNGSSTTVAGNAFSQQNVTPPNGFRFDSPSEDTVTLGANDNSVHLAVQRLPENQIQNTVDFSNGASTFVYGTQGSVQHVNAPAGYHFIDSDGSSVQLNTPNAKVNRNVAINSVTDTLHFSNGKTGAVTGNAFSVQPVTAPNGYKLTTPSEAHVTLGANDGNVNVSVEPTGSQPQQPNQPNGNGKHNGSQPSGNVTETVNFRYGDGTSAGTTSINGAPGTKQMVTAPNGTIISSPNGNHVTLGTKNGSENVSVIAVQNVTDTITFKANGRTKHVQMVSGPKDSGRMRVNLDNVNGYTVSGQPLSSVDLGASGRNYNVTLVPVSSGSQQNGGSTTPETPNTPNQPNGNGSNTPSQNGNGNVPQPNNNGGNTPQPSNNNGKTMNNLINQYGNGNQGNQSGTTPNVQPNKNGNSTQPNATNLNNQFTPAGTMAELESEVAANGYQAPASGTPKSTSSKASTSVQKPSSSSNNASAQSSAKSSAPNVPNQQVPNANGSIPAGYVPTEAGYVPNVSQSEPLNAHLANLMNLVNDYNNNVNRYVHEYGGYTSARDTDASLRESPDFTPANDYSIRSRAKRARQKSVRVPKARTRARRRESYRIRHGIAYVNVLKTLRLHSKPSFEHGHVIGRIKAHSITLRVRRAVRSDHHRVRFEVKYHGRIGFITARSDFVREAFVHHQVHNVRIETRRPTVLFRHGKRPVILPRHTYLRAKRLIRKGAITYYRVRGGFLTTNKDYVRRVHKH